MTRRSLFIGAACCALGVAAAINYNNSVEHHNFEFTVVVDTPNGQATGTGVIETIYKFRRTGRGDGVERKVDLTGDAVPVDLPDGRTLYMLVASPGGAWNLGAPWVEPQHEAEVYAGHSVTFLKDSKQAYGGDPGIPEMFYNNALPTFAMFTDPKKPSTIFRVDPTNASRTLGAGYAIKRISVRGTNDKASDVILSRLPWLEGWNGNMNGNRYGKDMSFADNINAQAFHKD